MSALRPQLDAGVCQLLAGCLSLQECRRLTGFDPLRPVTNDCFWSARILSLKRRYVLQSIVNRLRRLGNCWESYFYKVCS
jgi:hypothetical protein